MKKHGFSLAELLVALSIVAIGASIMVPIYLEARPDRYKFRVINCYNALNEATETLLSNPAIYYRNNPDDTCRGLECTAPPRQESGISLPVGTHADCKYPLLLKELLRIGDSSTTCTNGKLSGKTPDSVTWDINGNVTNGYNIMITLPASHFENECGPYAENCQNPNKFSFTVDQRGDVRGNDQLTRVYLRNMTNIHKKDDYNSL